MADDIDRVWELMKKISICMLASWDGHELHARPMGAYVRREDDAIYFLTDARHHKDQDIARYRKVCLAFADTSGQKYVSLAGDAEVSEPRHPAQTESRLALSGFSQKPTGELGDASTL